MYSKVISLNVRTNLANGPGVIVRNGADDAPKESGNTLIKLWLAVDLFVMSY